MVVSFFSLFHLALTLNALARSIRERFGWGIAGGLARLALMLAQVPLMWGRGLWTSVLGPQGVTPNLEMPAWEVDLVLISGIGGPLVSFGVLYLAYRRARDVPAAEEARAARPVNAWLGVAAQDAIFAVIGIAAAVFAADSY